MPSEWQSNLQEDLDENEQDRIAQRREDKAINKFKYLMLENFNTENKDLARENYLEYKRMIAPHIYKKSLI